MSQIESNSAPLTGLRENVPLAPLTTLEIGGPARYLLRASSESELFSAIDWAERRQLPLLILGGGSNLLVSDEGFRGLVVQVALHGIKVGRDGEFVTITAAAGENWDDLVAFIVESKLGGMECLSGIPGLVGATPIQNVGAYGQDVSQTIIDVRVFDRQTHQVRTFSNAECEFDYRQSRFKNREIDRYVVLSVSYRLLPDAKPCTLYPDIQRYLTEKAIEEPDLVQVREATIAVRRKKAMVIDPREPDSRSAGSFFTNPVISDELYASFLERVRQSGALKEGEKIPTYPAGPGRVKLSAAWLIEHAGFHKGLSLGNVGISNQHTLAIVNRGGGTAREVLELVVQIQQKVQSDFGIKIEPEPNFVGF